MCGRAEHGFAWRLRPCELAESEFIRLKLLGGMFVFWPAASVLVLAACVFALRRRRDVDVWPAVETVPETAAGLAAVGLIAGVEVPCITPELQIAWHQYPEFDDLDWADLRLLSDRFGLELPARCRKRPGFLAPKRRSGGV